MNSLFSFESSRWFDNVMHVVPTAVLGVLLAMILYGLYRYASSIRRHLRKIQESTLFGQEPKDPFRMIRRCNVNDCESSSSSSSSRLASLVDILPEFKKTTKMMSNHHNSHHHHRLNSLGSYLASLRPAIGPEKLPDFVENELQAALGAVVLRAIGPQFGAALLPGFAAASTSIQSTIVNLIQAAFSSTFLQTSKSTTTSETLTTTPPDSFSRSRSLKRGSITTNISNATTLSEKHHMHHNHHRMQGAPISIFAISYLAEINYNVTSARNDPTSLVNQDEQSSGAPSSSSTQPTPLDRLYLGEVGFEPSFSTCRHKQSNSIKAKENENDTNDTDTCMEDSLFIPNPFYLTRDWDKALCGMEDLLMQESSSSSSSKHKVTTNKSTKDDYETTNDASQPLTSDDVVTDKGTTMYDPHSKQMPPPVAVDERMLPDLHLGWGGDVLCTHSQREILQNRLLSCLLNRLAFNYYYSNNTNHNHHHSHSDCKKKQSKVFCIILDQSGGGGGGDDDYHDDQNKQIITKPSELIQALMDMGHSVEACITTHITSFGVALCVKEMDDSWTQIPLAYMLQTGYASIPPPTDDTGSNDTPPANRSLEAVCALPHSGLNMEIYNGPLLSKSSSSNSQEGGRMSIQHFMGVESFCGWQSNHNADVSWLRDVVCGKRLRFHPPDCTFTKSRGDDTTASDDNDKNRQDILTAVTLAALQAVTTNAVGTEQNLPLGGYGLTGVCNDSAAWLEQAIFGSTHIYPITMNGRFARLLLRSAVSLRESMTNNNGNNHNGDTDNGRDEPRLEQQHDMKAANQLIHALLELKSDMNSLPSQVLDQCRRQLHCIHPETPFASLHQSREILESIQKEFKSHYQY